MKRLTEYKIPETGFSVVSREKYKHILMEEKPSVEKVYNRLKKIEDILGDDYELDEISKIVRCKDCVYMVGRAEFPGECYCKILADTVPLDGFCHRGKVALETREQNEKVHRARSRLKSFKKNNPVDFGSIFSYEAHNIPLQAQTVS